MTILGTSPSRVLVVTKDPMLLVTRRELLQMAGYSVLSASSEIEAKLLCQTETIDLALLGYTLSESEKRSIAKAVKDNCGDLPILELCLHHPPVLNGAYLEGSPHPKELIEKVNQMLGQTGQRSFGKAR